MQTVAQKILRQKQVSRLKYWHNFNIIAAHSTRNALSPSEPTYYDSDIRIS
jgi:hypothetical protein